MVELMNQNKIFLFCVNFLLIYAKILRDILILN